MERSLLAGLVLVVTATGAACGGASPASPVPTAPAAVAAPIVGSWSGTFKTATCSGVCERPDDPARFALRLSGSSGVLVIGPPVSLEWQMPLVVDVTSMPAGSGFVITGQGPVPAGKREPRTVDVRLELDGLGDQLSGTIRYSWNDPRALGTTTKQGTIISSGRELPVAPSEFHGVWAGGITRTSCTGDCDAWDLVAELGDFRLTIAPSATATAAYVFRTMAWTASGNGITLSGHEETPTCRQQSYVDSLCTVDVSIVGFTDKVGRLTGTITYHVEWFAESGGHHSVTATADLSRVARWQ